MQQIPNRKIFAQVYLPPLIYWVFLLTTECLGTWDGVFIFIYLICSQKKKRKKKFKKISCAVDRHHLRRRRRRRLLLFSFLHLTMENFKNQSKKKIKIIIWLFKIQIFDSYSSTRKSVGKMSNNFWFWYFFWKFESNIYYHLRITFLPRFKYNEKLLLSKP